MHDIELVHAELVSIAIQRDRLQTRQARLLVLAEELEVWRHFSCAHIYEYLERFCDLHPRTARDYIRVARVLAALPLTRAKLEAEQIRYSTVRELTRIAMPETEAEWLAHVQGMTAREVEDEIAGRERGDRPHDPKDPDHLVKLTLEVRESTYAIFVDARMGYVDDQGERLSDDDVVLVINVNAGTGSQRHVDRGCANDAAAAEQRPVGREVRERCRSRRHPPAARGRDATSGTT
jgi:hypothetical protein